jgi:hypothetical protein
VGRLVAKWYAAEGHRRSDRALQFEAQEMSKHWAADRRGPAGGGGAAGAGGAGDMIAQRRPVVGCGARTC